jgi:2-phospho-L-lactate guanylyltransferase
VGTQARPPALEGTRRAEWSGSWVVALPLKGLAEAKSRILLPPRVRASLALAMALDTATAALACPRVSAVWVVCGDRHLAPAFTALGCSVLDDPGVGGLNGALTVARERIRETAPAEGFASLVADLPALRGQDLAAALAAAGRYEGSFVPDAAGRGTTLLAALPGAEYVPAYGGASAALHQRAGAMPLPLPADSPLRRDVDTVSDLQRAAGGGVGAHTRRVLASLPGRPPSPRAPCERCPAPLPSS